MSFKCSCCDKEHVFENIPDGWIHLDVDGEEYAMQCPHCSPSYLTYKPEIHTEDICYNAGSDLCKNCFEPECAYSQEIFEPNLSLAQKVIEHES